MIRIDLGIARTALIAKYLRPVSHIRFFDSHKWRIQAWHHSVSEYIWLAHSPPVLGQIDDILRNISINEEERKIVEKLKKADTYRDLSIDEYYIIKDLFSLDEMEE